MAVKASMSTVVLLDHDHHVDDGSGFDNRRVKMVLEMVEKGSTMPHLRRHDDSLIKRA